MSTKRRAITAIRELWPVALSKDTTVNVAREVDRIWCHSSEAMPELPDNSVALVVTSPPYNLAQEYEPEVVPLEEHFALLLRVFAECGGN